MDRYIATYVQTYMHACTPYIHVYRHTYMRVHVYIHTYVRTYINTYMHACTQYIHALTHTLIFGDIAPTNEIYRYGTSIDTYSRILACTDLVRGRCIAHERDTAPTNCHASADLVRGSCIPVHARMHKTIWGGYD